MEDTTTVTSEGTEQSGSQVTEVVADQGAGMDGAGTAPEPTIRIGDKEVPLSVAERALKNDERFTQESQEHAARRKELEAREARLMEREAQLGSLDALAGITSNQRVMEAIAQADPEFAARIPAPVDQEHARALAENLRLKFELFTARHAEFDEEQLDGIRAEALRLAKSGRIEDATDFENIGYRLYRDQIIEREAEKRAAEKLAKEKERLKQQQSSGTVPAGMPAIPHGTDMSKLNPIQKLTLARQMKSKK